MPSSFSSYELILEQERMYPEGRSLVAQSNWFSLSFYSRPTLVTLFALQPIDTIKSMSDVVGA